MNRYRTTTWNAKLAFAGLTIAVALTVLESVVGGMLHADPERIAARREAITAQALAAEKSRELHEGKVMSAEVRYDVR
jgi:hypothetical protein